MPRTIRKLCPHDKTELKRASSDPGIVGYIVQSIQKQPFGIAMGHGFTVDLLMCETCRYVELEDHDIVEPESQPQKIVFPSQDTGS